jgi:hypothetical protein
MTSLRRHARASCSLSHYLTFALLLLYLCGKRLILWWFLRTRIHFFAFLPNRSCVRAIVLAERTVMMLKQLLPLTAIDCGNCVCHGPESIFHCVSIYRLQLPLRLIQLLKRTPPPRLFAQAAAVLRSCINVLHHKRPLLLRCPWGQIPYHRMSNDCNNQSFIYKKCCPKDRWSESVTQLFCNPSSVKNVSFMALPQSSPDCTCVCLQIACLAA